MLGWPEARADPRSGIQRLVSYLVSSTPSGNVRVCTRFRFTQLSRAVKNGRAAAHQDRCGGQHVLVDQPGPHRRRGKWGAADVHGTAILGRGTAYGARLAHLAAA